jgi:hypothetical protein
MSAISASFRGLSQQSHLLRGWSFTDDSVTAQGLRTRIIVDNLLQFDCEATDLAWKRDDSIRT